MSLSNGQETDVDGTVDPVDPVPRRIAIRGRSFALEEILRIRSIIEASPGDHRFALSKKASESLGWVQPNGRLKDRSCRDALRRLYEQGVIRLPPPRR